MAFPPAHFLVGCGSAELVCSATPLPRWKAWLVGGTLAVIPDLDIVIGLATGHGAALHGTFTHSVLAVAVVGLVVSLVAGRRWGAVAVAGYGSHLLVDLLDSRGPTNVLLGWPFLREQPFAIAKIFPIVHFEQGRGPWGAAASLLHRPALDDLALQTLTGAAGFAILLLLSASIRWFRSSRRAPSTSRGR